MVEAAAPRPTALDSAATGRADVTAAWSGVRAAEARVKGARSPFFPSVSAHAGVEHNSEDVFGAGGDQWLVGVGARWTFDLGVPSQTGAASAQAEAARRRAHLATENARHEVRVAEARLAAARRRSDALSRALDAARDSFRLTRSRHAEGLSTAFDLISAQNTLTRTQLEARAAEHDVLLAETALRLASGTLELPEVVR
jgi:outer membrane protein TolC